MPTTISVDLPHLAGEAGPYTLFLRTKAGTLVNTGGDTLTEFGTGRWSASVAEALTDDLVARIYEGSTETAANIEWSGWLPNGETELRSEYPSSGSLTTDQSNKLTDIYNAIYPANPSDAPLVITPSDPDHVTGWSVCYGLDGNAAAGIVVTYKLVTTPPRDTGKILNGSTTGSETSAVNGLVQFEGLLPGATYSFTCGATTVTCTIPLDASPTAGYQLPSFVKT